MAGFEHKYTDPAGSQMLIRKSLDKENSAYLRALAEGVAVPAHRLAEFTRALWAAAGQVVPDLPVIYDPEHVEALSKDIHYALHGTSNPDGYQAPAVVLLSLGWRKT